MLSVLDRDYKQSVQEMAKEFPGCQFVFLLENATDDSGYLLAVSHSMSSFAELMEFMNSQRARGIVARAGLYKGGVLGGLLKA